MVTESAREALGEGCAGSPTGFRRLTPSLLRADRTAAGFDGLPEGVEAPGQLLAAFKAAAARLGLSPRLVHAVDWLFRFTRPQDWGRGGRPIVWPSAGLQQEAFGLSESRVKALNRALIEAGVVTMKDSPNGKRYGVRDRAGRITEAYGFDLSPIAARYSEFVRLAEEARAERTEMGRLRRRATIARKGITQILETAAEYHLDGEDWASLAQVHGRSIFGQIFEHCTNTSEFDVLPTPDDDRSRPVLLQKSVAFDVSMATVLCDRQSVDSARHPTMTLKRSFTQQRLLPIGRSASGCQFSVRSKIWPKIDRPCTWAA